MNSAAFDNAIVTSTLEGVDNTEGKENSEIMGEVDSIKIIKAHEDSETAKGEISDETGG